MPNYALFVILCEQYQFVPKNHINSSGPTNTFSDAPNTSKKISCSSDNHFNIEATATQHVFKQFKTKSM